MANPHEMMVSPFTLRTTRMLCTYHAALAPVTCGFPWMLHKPSPKQWCADDVAEPASAASAAAAAADDDAPAATECPA